MEDARERAGRELLALPPPPGDGPEPDWEGQKREMLDARMRKRDDSPGPDREARGGGFASLHGVWRGRVTIADDFDELSDDLVGSDQADEEKGPGAKG